MKHHHTSRGEDFLDFLLLLRYGNTQASIKDQPILNLKAVAHIAGASITQTAAIIKQGLQARALGQPIPRRSRSKVTADHIDYLVSTDTLRAWSHLSLEQRVKYFHRQFPDITISPFTLWSIYRKHGIKYKVIQKVKKVIDYQVPSNRRLFETMERLLKLVSDHK